MLDTKTKDAITKYWDERYKIEKDFITKVSDFPQKELDEAEKYMDLKEEQFSFAIDAYIRQVVADNNF